jgi:maltooligosyltrehalose trehalohydrolase
LTSPSLYRTMTALLLLAPGTPMLFQGQEFSASSPFLYFVDLSDTLSKAVHEGRLEFLSQFPSLATPDLRANLPDSASVSTFLRSKLDLSERVSHGREYALHKDLLRLRREDPVFSAQNPGTVDGAVLADGAFVLRYFGAGDDDRLLVVNLGADLGLVPLAEPLLAPPAGKTWGLLWSSEDHRYGGLGIPPFHTGAGWSIPAASASVLTPVAGDEEPEGRLP